MVNKNKLTLILLGMILIALTGCVTHEDVFVNGTVNITGSALSSGMEGYVIEVGQGMDPTSWTTLGVVLTDEGNLNINESLLAVWNTSAVSNGKHTIRLTVTDSNGVSSQDLIYVTVDNINDTPTLPCPTWSCDGLVEGLNSVDVGLTPEQYGCNMNCSITCECPNNMHMVVNSTGDLEYSYDFLYLDATSHTGSWSGSDSFNDTVDILFSSDHSLDGSSGYAGFNITGITCTPYCLSQSSYYSSEYIERVELNTGVSSSSGSCYSDHTSPVLTTLVTGHSYTLYVDVSTTYLYTEYVKAWIDFNHDFDFSDTGEEINLGSYGVDGTYTFSKDFTVPAGAIYGNTRMRVSAKWSSAPLPCGLFSYGEVEDYTVWISSSVTTTTTSTTLPSNHVYVDPHTQATDVDDTVTVAIEVDDVTDLYSFQFDIGFDPDVLEGVLVAEGDFLSSGGTTTGLAGTIDNTAGTITGSAYTLTGMVPGVSGSGTLATITFTASANGTSDIELSNVELVTSSVTVMPSTTTDGSVTVGALVGDINGDGSVSIFDLVLMGQAWGSSPGDPNYNADADLNADGIINLFDLVILAQNWNP